MNYEYKVIAPGGDFASAYSVRERVFVLGQRISPDIERDEHDASAFHVVAFDRAEPIGTGRLVIGDGFGKIGRMAVLSHYRGRSVGGAILRRLLDVARSLRLPLAVLHAQADAVPFYERHGFAVRGEPFAEAGIEHVKMEKLLTAGRE